MNRPDSLGPTAFLHSTKRIDTCLPADVPIFPRLPVRSGNHLKAVATADDRHSAAPDLHGIPMKGEFVQDNVAAESANGVRVRGHGDDARSVVVKRDLICLFRRIWKLDLFEIESLFHSLQMNFAVFDGFFRLPLRGRDPNRSAFGG